MSAGREQNIEIYNPKSNYTDRNNGAKQLYHEGEQTAIFTRRIGSTVYRVGVHFSRTSKETLNDKITRLAKNDVSGRAANQ